MSFTPKEKEEIYKNTNIIHKDDNFLIVEPLSRDSIEYYNGSNIMVDYYGRKYRNGTIYLIIDTQTTPVEVLSVFIPNDSNDIEYIDYDGESFITQTTFFNRIPNPIFDKVKELIIQNTTYGRLLRIANGEELEFVDELITKIKFSENNPRKSILYIGFEDEQTYFKTIGINEYNIWIFDTLFGGYYYGGSLNLYDSYRAYDDFKEGYVFRHFSDENMEKLNEIIKYISPENYNFQPQEIWGEVVSEKLLDLFGVESDNIIETMSQLENECIDNSVKTDLTDLFCDVYNNYGIFVQSCFLKYFTSVGMLISTYNRFGDKTLSLKELFKEIMEPYTDEDFQERIYETYCNENYDEEFNKEVETQLDKILETIEEGDMFVDIKGFNELYTQAVNKYGINKYNAVPKDKTKKFRILGINPSINKILIEVVDWDNNQFEKRELDIEEFNNFLYTGELF
jgi:hypothetical protein